MTSHTFNLTPFPRMNAGWLVGAKRLQDGEWHRHDLLADTMAAESDLERKTCVGILQEAYRKGLLEKRWAAKKLRYYRVKPEFRVDVDNMVANG